MSATGNRNQQFAEFMRGIQPLLEQAFDEGYANGFHGGRLLGYIEGVNALTPAVSDGLRHGSSECGKAMQGLKNLGLDIEPNEREG